ncbi:hypothetical protein [Marinovum sp.]|nr:hypothetical protein [Marinovum sp.]
MTPCAILALEARARRMAALGVSITFAPCELSALADWLAQQAPRAPP